MLFQLKLQSKIGTSKPLPIKKRRPDLEITLKKCVNGPLRANFRALLAKWDTLLLTSYFLTPTHAGPFAAHVSTAMGKQRQNFQRSSNRGESEYLRGKFYNWQKLDFAGYKKVGSLCTHNLKTSADALRKLVLSNFVNTENLCLQFWHNFHQNNPKGS